MWGWRGAQSEENVRAKVVEVLAKRGFVAASPDMLSVASVRVVADSDGHIIVSSAAISGGETIAAELSRALAIGGRYAEVDLYETDVTAIARDVAHDGMLGFAEDYDHEARRLCKEWFGDRRFGAEVIDDLVATFLDVDGGMPPGGTVMGFAKRRGRVESLVDAVEKGATWDRMEVAGRDAIRLQEPAGPLRISVLEADELTRFEAAVRKRG